MNFSSEGLLELVWLQRLLLLKIQVRLMLHLSALAASWLTSPFCIPAPCIHSVFRNVYGLMQVLCPLEEKGGVAKILGCISSY